MVVQVTTRVLKGTANDVVKVDENNTVDTIICQNGPLSNAQIDTNFMGLVRGVNKLESEVASLKVSSDTVGLNTKLTELSDDFDAYTPVSLRSFSTDDWVASLDSEDLGAYILTIPKDDVNNTIEGVFRGSIIDGKPNGSLAFIDIVETATQFKLRALSGFSGYLYIGGMQTPDRSNGT